MPRKRTCDPLAAKDWAAGDSPAAAVPIDHHVAGPTAAHQAKAGPARSNHRSNHPVPATTTLTARTAFS